DIRDSKDYDDVYRDLKSGKTGHKSVGVDSITETQISALLEILEKDTVNRADPDQLAQQDWGIVLIRMRRIVRQYVKMLPMHVFMTALSKDDVVPRVGSVKAPQVQGAFATELPGILDVVAYLALGDVDEATGDVERILLLNSNPRFSVKSRTPWGVSVPSEIVNPTITKVLDALGF
ncbi:MAG TPA: AAA family ATPase, partial [Thermoanaerobaculia bacterium]